MNWTNRSGGEAGTGTKVRQPTERTTTDAPAPPPAEPANRLPAQASGDAPAPNGRTAPRSMSTPIAASAAALAVVAVICFVGAWQAATGRGGLGAFAVVAGFVVVGFGLMLLLDAALFRPHRERLGIYLLGLATTVAALGLAWWLAAAGVTGIGASRVIIVAICLVRPLLGGVQSSRRPRRVWWQFLAAIGIWNAILAIYLIFGHDLPPWDRVVWGSSDQVTMGRIARRLLLGEVPYSSFLLGVPVLAALMLVAVDHVGPNAILATNHANLIVAPILAGAVMPGLIWGVGRAACRAAAVRMTWLRMGLGMFFMAGLILTYIAFAPDYVLERNSILVPRRLLGLVFGPEPLGFVALAGALLVLSSRKRRWNPVIVGVGTGLAAMVHERFLPGALMFLTLLVITSATRRRALIAAGISIVTFTPQLVYFQLAYGTWLFPNRSSAWERGERAQHWQFYAQQRYHLPPDALPSRMSLDYLAVNTADMLKYYGVVLAMALIAAVLLLRRHPRQWPVWTFCCGHIVITFLMSALYINATVTWRYNALALPVVAFLLIAAAWSFGPPPAGPARTHDRAASRRPAGRRQPAACEAVRHGS